jgi:pyrimidine-nucleoside phosphorylase
MEEPLGHTVGNALEVREAIETLRGGGPADLRALTLDLAEAVSHASRENLTRWLDDGTAWEKFVALVVAQGGDANCLDEFDLVHPAPVVRELTAPKTGTVSSLRAEAIGRASVELGAGRSQAEDAIDFAVGFSELIKVGTEVSQGDRVGMVHARDEASADQAESSFHRALTID